MDWARHQVIRNQFHVLDNRTADLIAELSTAEIPVEFAIVSFSGVGRAPGLESDLTAFIGDCRHRGLPFIGYLGDHLVSKKKAEGHMVGLALFPPQTVKFTLLPLVPKSCSCKTTSMTLPLAGETA